MRAAEDAVAMATLLTAATPQTAPRLRDYDAEAAARLPMSSSGGATGRW